MPAAAPPPMPLKRATIWGMPVIATFFAAMYPKPPPMTIPMAIRAKLVRFVVRKVASVAISIAAPAQTIPLRAVSGWLIRCRPMMKKKMVAI